MATCITDNKEKKLSGLNLSSSYFLNFEKKKIYCLVKNCLRVNKYIDELINNINEAYQF